MKLKDGLYQAFDLTQGLNFREINVELMVLGVEAVQRIFEYPLNGKAAAKDGHKDRCRR